MLRAAADVDGGRFIWIEGWARNKLDAMRGPQSELASDGVRSRFAAELMGSGVRTTGSEAARSCLGSGFPSER
jgi:hypothetical protein